MRRYALYRVPILVTYESDIMSLCTDICMYGLDPAVVCVCVCVTKIRIALVLQGQPTLRIQIQ